MARGHDAFGGAREAPAEWKSEIADALGRWQILTVATSTAPGLSAWFLPGTYARLAAALALFLAAGAIAARIWDNHSLHAIEYIVFRRLRPRAIPRPPDEQELIESITSSVGDLLAATEKRAEERDTHLQLMIASPGK